MTNWEITRYLIDAKKCVDSVMFIARHKKALSNIDIRARLKSILQGFYINCCIVIDATYPSRNDRMELKKQNEIINAVYYERDKDKAHKDANYKTQQFKSFVELSVIMKKQLLETKRVCDIVLPPNITLDFVPHDRELFRLINSVTPEKEEEIKKLKHPHYERDMKRKDTFDRIVKAFHDTEELRDIPQEELDQYGVVVEAGINIFEAVQNRQDFCIKVNVLAKKNIWCFINEKDYNKMLELKKAGFLDVFDVPHFPSESDIEGIKRYQEIMCI